MSSNKVSMGDVILTSDKGFLPTAIKLFMKKYADNLGLGNIKVYNHVAVVIIDNGELKVAESMIKGVQIKYSPEEYLKKHPDHLIRTWVKPLNVQELVLWNNTIIEFSRHITRYDFMNFWYQIKLITNGVWKGKTGEESEKRLYCSELAAVAMDDTRGSFNGQTWDKNPLDIQLSKDLKDKY